MGEGSDFTPQTQPTGVHVLMVSWQHPMDSEMHRTFPLWSPDRKAGPLPTPAPWTGGRAAHPAGSPAPLVSAAHISHRYSGLSQEAMVMDREEVIIASGVVLFPVPRQS